MADKVFINGMAAVHAGSSAQGIAMPDVCLCPPAPPAGPIPTPLPNTFKAADLTCGASTVTIEGNPVGNMNSYIKQSIGNAVSRPTGGGVITHAVEGAAYPLMGSFDVFIESSPALKVFDLWTANHMPGAKMPPNTPPTPLMGAMSVPSIVPKVSEIEANEGKDFVHLVLRDELQRAVAALDLVIETPGKQTIRRRTPSGGEVIIRSLKKGSCQVTLLDWQGKPMKEVKAKSFAPAPDGAPASLPTGKKHELICQIATLTVDFEHPKPGKMTFPKLVLESSDGKFKQQRTPRNNLNRDARHVRVHFDYLPKGARFTLTKHYAPGHGDVLFKDAPFDDIVDRGGNNEGK
jgi:hypothetical protein